MRKNINEIQTVLKNNGYSINTIICDVMKTFKFKSLCRQVGFQKKEGYNASEILSLMLMLPLMLLNSVHALYRSEFQKVTDMKKDAIYRLKNNENMPWRSLLLNVVKTFIKQVNPNKEIAANSAFILDDTTEAKTGRRIEQISYIYDHVAGRKGSKLGFKNLTLGLFDGKSLLPIDFSLHSEKPLKAKHRKERYQKQRAPKSSGVKRMKECSTDKISKTLYDIKWDSITLKKMPSSLIYCSEEEGVDYSVMALGENDLLPAEVRDTEEDVLDAIDEISKKYPWSWLGEAGESLDRILAGIDKENTHAISVALEKYLELTCVFPFEAIISEHQGRGPLKEGDRISVKGISGDDDLYGIIVETRQGRKKYHVPLLDLEVSDKKSVNHQPVEVYKTWFANQ